jgi:stress response protein YsnF
MINLDVLQEQRYCHTSGQQMRVPLSANTGSIPRQTIPTFEVTTASRTLRDASNLTAKSNHSDSSTPSAISCTAN